MATASRVSYPPRVFRHRIKELLAVHPSFNASVEKLAHRVGVTPLTMRRILQGCDLKMTTALKIAQCLNVSLIDLDIRNL